LLICLYPKINFQNISVGIENIIPKVGNTAAKSSSNWWSAAIMEDVIIGGMAHSIIEILFGNVF
jgi:hypothetical protein